MKVIAMPKAGSAYTECFYRAVEHTGLTVIDGDMSGRWLRRNACAGDVVHLNWPSFAYGRSGSKFLQRVWFARFALLLLWLRARRVRLMWTAHNLLPHDRACPAWIDVQARHLVIALSEAIFVHGDGAAAVLVARFPACAAKLQRIPHGNWIGFYPTTLDRAQARAKFALAPATFAFLFIGYCKPYKNLDGLLAAFRALPGDCALLVAGTFQDEDYRRSIEALAQQDSRVQLFAGYVAPEQMAAYLQACDGVVVPYREVLTSGTALLALSFGRPVLSVEGGFLGDVVNERCGVLFRSGAGAPELTRALQALRSGVFAESDILQHARRYSFDEAARTFADAVRLGKSQ